jgi:hypothetical protein
MCYPPGPGTCQPSYYGCDVTVCPCPCSNPGDICNKIQNQIPPIKGLPGGVQPCVIVTECPPTTPPVTIDIYRNCYVPIYITAQGTPTNVTPVNINVKWREVHYLSDAQGNPITQQQAQAAIDAACGTAGAGVIGAYGTPQGMAAPQAAPAPHPAAAPPAPPVPQAGLPAQAPAMRWVFLTKQNVWGYGYQRADGLWVIDPASKRATPPEGIAAQPVQAAPATPVFGSTGA